MKSKAHVSPRRGADFPLEAGDGTTGGSLSGSQALLEESVEFFVSFVQIFGLPKSIGQIYGLLFVSTEALPMDEIVSRIGISKGSASQGLTLLKSLGAVVPKSVPLDRREHFLADLNVSRIVSHFFENRLQPRLEHGDQRLARMLELAESLEGDDPPEGGGQLRHRIRALQKWQKRGRGLVPLVVRWLKR